MTTTWTPARIVKVHNGGTQFDIDLTEPRKERKAKEGDDEEDNDDNPTSFFGINELLLRRKKTCEEYEKFKDKAGEPVTRNKEHEHEHKYGVYQ